MAARIKIADDARTSANFFRGGGDIPVVGSRLSDSAVLDICSENPAAFGRLYERHSPMVARYIARRVGAVMAEDLTAEVFVAAFRARAACRCERGSALPWLLGVANHVVADHHRAEQRRLRALERLARQTPGPALDDDAAVPPELIQALRRLPAKDRDALLLVVWGELSYEETATALDVPVGTVRSRISRARRRLVPALGPRCSSAANEFCAKGQANA